MTKLKLVSIQSETFAEVMNAIPPDCRFTNVEEWGFNHFWMYSPNGDILIFTPDPIVKLESRRFNIQQ